MPRNSQVIDTFDASHEGLITGTIPADEYERYNGPTLASEEPVERRFLKCQGLGYLVVIVEQGGQPEGSEWVRGNAFLSSANDGEDQVWDDVSLTVFLRETRRWRRRARVYDFVLQQIKPVAAEAAEEEVATVR